MDGRTCLPVYVVTLIMRVERTEENYEMRENHMKER